MEAGDTLSGHVLLHQFLKEVTDSVPTFGKHPRMFFPICHPRLPYKKKKILARNADLSPCIVQVRPHLVSPKQKAPPTSVTSVYNLYIIQRNNAEERVKK